MAWFPNGCALNSKGPMAAVLSAAKNKLNYTVVEDRLDADVAVIWSVLWHGRMATNEAVYQHYRKQGKPVIVIDVGALRRNVTWKLAVNHINALGYYGHTTNLDLDRPKKLGLTIAHPTKINPAILIATQHQKSLQLQNISQEELINKQIRMIQQHSARLIVVRSHPRCPLNWSDILRPGVTQQIPRSIASTYDSYDVDYNYHAVINHNSGPGIQAALAGIQVIVDNSSLAYPVSNVLEQIDNYQFKDRSNWVIQISHTEYTVDELQQGVWIDRISTALQ